MALRPNAGHDLLIHEVSRSHTTTYHSRYDSFGRMISSSQRPLPDNTQYSQQTNIHAPGGIQTHDLSRRAVADLRLRPRGYWDLLITDLHAVISSMDKRGYTVLDPTNFTINNKLLLFIIVYVYICLFYVYSFYALIIITYY